MFQHLKNNIIDIKAKFPSYSHINKADVSVTEKSNGKI